MKIIKFLLIVFISICCIISCVDRIFNPLAICNYKMGELVLLDSSNLLINSLNDTLFEVTDSRMRTTGIGGVYVFDKNRNLKMYTFMKNNHQFSFQENYDEQGRLIKRVGSPLIETQLWNENDSTLLNATIFSMNRAYKLIEIITSENDTIQPQYLYKSDKYSNAKVFPFKIPKSKNESILLYFKCSFSETCADGEGQIKDTLLLKLN